MKKIFFLFGIIILLANILSTNGDNLEVITNISLEKASCNSISKWIITSEEEGYMKFENRWHGILKKEKVNKSSIRVFSSEGPLNFSIVDIDHRDRILIDDFQLMVGPNESTYFGWYTERPKCFQFKKDWSLIRIPIRKGLTVEGLINFTLNIDHSLGYNKNGYIYLIGIPFPTAKYMDISKAEIISEDPLSINFQSRIRDNSTFLVTSIDLYYLPLPLLKIRQSDVIDLINEEFARTAYALNLHNKSVFYNNKENKITIFQSEKEIVEGIEILNSRGEVLFFSEEGKNLELTRNSCFLSKNKFFFPFQCIDIEGTFDVANYLIGNEDTLLVDFYYILRFRRMDNFKIKDSSRCISYSQIMIPPIQVIQDIKQPAYILQLPKVTSICNNNRVTITHGNVAQYISPELISTTNDFMKEENSFKATNFSINIPSSSISIYFKAKLKNYLRSKIIFYVYIILFTFLFFINIYVIRKKVKRNAKNKSRLLLYIFSSLIAIFSELAGIFMINPKDSIITLLTLTPLFGFIFGWILFKLFESRYIKSKLNIYQHFPDRLKQ